MNGTFSRRAALGLGIGGAAAMTLGVGATAVNAQGATDAGSAHAHDRIRETYRRETRRAGGTWYSLISAVGEMSNPVTV